MHERQGHQQPAQVEDTEARHPQAEGAGLQLTRGEQHHQPQQQHRRQQPQVGERGTQVDAGGKGGAQQDQRPQVCRAHVRQGQLPEFPQGHGGGQQRQQPEAERLAPEDQQPHQG
jgi:hypothetical protein